MMERPNTSHSTRPTRGLFQSLIKSRSSHSLSNIKTDTVAKDDNEIVRQKKPRSFHRIRNSYHNNTNTVLHKSRPTDNKHWEITFAALGFKREMLDQFWNIFCHMNTSGSGEIDVSEFLDYFQMDRTPYVEKCFAYFDTTGGDSIDFLEFMISVWNICTLKVDTLTNFTFDLYDLDSDGELSLPEIELMVQELYYHSTDHILIPVNNNNNTHNHNHSSSSTIKHNKKNGESVFVSADGTNNQIIMKNNNKKTYEQLEVWKDINRYAEDRGGVLDLTSFTIYTMNHSMFLYPVFQIQRRIQKRIMGMSYWSEMERSRPEGKSNQNSYFDPRHVQIFLRTYRTGAAAAVLTHTGDSNAALRLFFQEQEDETNDAVTTKQDNVTTTVAAAFQQQTKLSNRWNTVKEMIWNDGQSKMRDTYEKMKQNMKHMQERNNKTPRHRTKQSAHEMVISAFSSAGKAKQVTNNEDSQRGEIKHTKEQNSSLMDAKVTRNHSTTTSSSSLKPNQKQKDQTSNNSDKQTMDAVHHHVQEDTTILLGDSDTTVNKSNIQPNEDVMVHENPPWRKKKKKKKKLKNNKLWEHQMKRRQDADARMRSTAKLRPRTPGSIITFPTNTNNDT